MNSDKRKEKRSILAIVDDKGSRNINPKISVKFF